MSPEEIKMQFDQALSTLEKLDPIQLNRRQFVGIDTFYPRKTEIESLKHAFEDLLSQSSLSLIEKKNYLDAFRKKANHIIQLLKMPTEQRQATHILAEMYHFQANIADQLIQSAAESTSKPRSRL